MSKDAWWKNSTYRTQQGQGPGNYSNRSYQEQQVRQAARDAEIRRQQDAQRQTWRSGKK
jgi:hypothetical protein